MCPSLPSKAKVFCEHYTYNCNSYCEMMDAKLSYQGFTTTFTVISLQDPSGVWMCNPNQPRWLWNHTLADVHWSDGKISWIEPEDVPPRAIEPIDMHDGTIQIDNDNNGTVDYSDGKHVDDPTDGDLRIEVYDSRSDAEAA